MGWDGEIDEDEGIDPVRFDLIDMTDCSKSELDGAKERRKDWVEGRTRICSALKHDGSCQTSTPLRDGAQENEIFNLRSSSWKESWNFQFLGGMRSSSQRSSRK